MVSVSHVLVNFIDWATNACEPATKNAPKKAVRIKDNFMDVKVEVIDKFIGIQIVCKKAKVKKLRPFVLQKNTILCQTRNSRKMFH